MFHSSQNQITSCGSLFLEWGSRTYIMGILNMTPDSFSDGGRLATLNKALEHSLQLVKDGAAILDIGGESTRPGSEPVSTEEELERVLPLVKALKDTQNTTPISIDTSKAAVAAQAIEAGASIINDVRISV